MRVESRLKRIEKQFDVGHDIKRTVLVVGPKRERQTEADKAERRANIDRAVQEVIRRDPTRTFIFLLA